MSNREQVIEIVNAMPERRIISLLAFLQSFEDIPNGETIAAIKEMDEMIRSGAGQHFRGKAADFFAMLDGDEDA